LEFGGSILVVTSKNQLQWQQLLVAAWLLINGSLSLAIVHRHVALRDAWRTHDMALLHWQASQERP
jgi:hypothetical protein